MSVDLFISGYPSCSWYATSFSTASFSKIFSPRVQFPFFTMQLQNTISKSMCFRVSYVCKLSNFDDAKLGWYFFGFNDCLPPTLMKHITPPSNPYIHGVWITFNHQGVNRNELLQLLVTEKQIKLLVPNLPEDKCLCWGFGVCGAIWKMITGFHINKLQQ